jgi:hypothetical protein
VTMKCAIKSMTVHLSDKYHIYPNIRQEFVPNSISEKWGGGGVGLPCNCAQRCSKHIMHRCFLENWRL